MEREACVCDHGFERSDLCAEIIIIIIRHRVSPEFIGSRHCVPTAFSAESSPAQGQ